MLQKLKYFTKTISIVLIQGEKLIALVQLKKIIGSIEHWVETVVLRCSIKKCGLKNFAEFTGKHLHQSLVLNEVAGLRPATLLKKTLAQVFSCEF